MPIAIYTGIDDHIAPYQDARVINSTLSDLIVDYQEIPGGHIVFFVAKNIDYFYDSMLPLIN